jgi:hypothetical protein
MKLTEEYCKAVAKTCKTMKDFWSKCRSVATKAQKAGWIDSYTWLARERVKRNSLDEEECRRIAKKFKTIRDFRTKAQSAYVTANRHGWIQSFTWLEREIGEKHYRTKDDIVKVARKFKTVKDFCEQYPNEYRYAWAHGWLKECTWLKRENRGRK